MAILIFTLPTFLACISCRGIVLGLYELQEADPALAQGLALAVVAMIKAGSVAFAGLFITVLFWERHELAQHIRNEVYEAIEEDIISPLR